MPKMNLPHSSCPHINVIGNYTKEDVIAKQKASECDGCNSCGPNLFVCLHRDCLYVGCSDANTNHSIKHFQRNNEHSLFLNLSSLRVWCHRCELEVFLENNDPPIPGMLPSQPLLNRPQDTDSEEEFDSDENNLKPRGLTGLQNLGNTCYMNSAIQALSNCPQLTNFFLECGSFVRTDRKSGLSRNYMTLVREMWHKKRPSYVVPNSISYGIKMVFPVFRGNTQQDAQEFLRCFMDQLHEELKEPFVEIPGRTTLSSENQEDFDNCPGEASMGVSEDSSQSEAEFETCDSGLSSEKSSCLDETGEMTELTIDRDDDSQQTSPDMQQKSVFAVSNRDADLSEPWTPLVTGDNASTGRGETDSGVPNTTSADASECDSFMDHRPQNSFRRNERYVSYSSNRGPFQTWQATQSQRRSMSPHSILSTMYSAQRRKQVHYRSIISDIFDGKLLSSVQCLTCDTVSTTRETFQDLSLPIPNRDHLHMIHASQGSYPKGGACTDVYNQQSWISWFLGWMLSWFWGPAVSLQDCLSAFFSADELKGDNMYSCEKCKLLRNGVKYSKVVELPEVLCIHLKRFRHEVMFSCKISSYVSFPLEGLDMSAFLNSSYPHGVTKYDLAAVICHHGTAGSGHYTAYALNCLNDQWYEFDDQCVTAVDTEIVRHCEAYVLFYRKSSDEMMKKRHCAVELLERSKNEQSLLKFHISKQWVNKFNNFAEPGPISNTDFLCVHGGVPPQKAAFANDLCICLPRAVWEYLHETFGGGPSCTHLYICAICQNEQDNLNQRRKTELDQFIAMNNEFKALDNPAVLYAISTGWFKSWEKFVRGKENEPPGPIDNGSICVVKNGQAVLKLGSDYGSLSEDMWKYLLTIYGGGPDIAQKTNIVNTGANSTSNQLSTSPSASPASTRATHIVASSSSQQSPQVHSSSRSHSQSSASSRVPQDQEIVAMTVEPAKETPSTDDPKMDTTENE